MNLMVSCAFCFTT